MNRREFTQVSAAASVAALLAKHASAEQGAKPMDAAEASRETAEQQHSEAMQRYAALTQGPKVTIGMLVYPGMFLQDLVGPLTVFESLMNREIHLLWKNLDAVGNEKTDHTTFIPVPPTTRFEDCPADLDVLFVPGGVPGTLSMMEDAQVLSFLADHGKHARFVTSVCTGSLILAAAGLLQGYRATSHWVTLEVLAEMGAIPTKGRIVVDRNRITGGGVTAGIDFALQIAALLRSDAYAQAIQLYLEYDPAPPFDAGSPEKAPAIVNQFLTDMFAGLKDSAAAAAKRAKQRLS